MFCIYRKLFGQGITCKCKAIQNHKFCKKHIDSDYHIFHLMNECIDEPKIIKERQIYKMFWYINNNDIFDKEDKEDKEDKKQTDIEKNLIHNNHKFIIFSTIVDYLFSKSKLIDIIHESIYINKSKNICESKKVIIKNLFKLFSNTLRIGSDESKIIKIIKIQKIMRGALYRKLIKLNKTKPENDTDPFTFDDVNDIPSILKFSYKDGNNHIYCYNILQFRHFLKTNGLWNPYTREALPKNVLNKVELLIKYHNLQTNDRERNEWITELQAYTELSQAIEKAGFYNNVSWFEQMSYPVCKNIIKTYRLLCSNIQNSTYFFPSSFELRESCYVFDFCKEVIKMFENADDHYLICCNFIKALALNIDDFYYNIPSWLSNIESDFNLGNDYQQLHNYTYLYIFELLNNFNN